MSVINRMLNSLEERNAPPADKTVLDQELRAVKAKPRAQRRLLPIIAGIVMMLSAVYWLTFRPVLQSKRARGEVTVTLPSAVPTPTAKAGSGAPKPPPAAANVPASPPGQVAAAPTPPTQLAALVPSPSAPEIMKAPEPVRASDATVKSESRPRRGAKSVPVESAAPSSQLATRESNGSNQSVALAAPVEAFKAESPLESRPSRHAPARSKDDALGTNRTRITTRSSADREFQQAATLLNQGRMDEAIEGMRAALRLDPTHLSARQSVVAILIEKKRFGEARATITEGLELTPGNAGLAIALARLVLDGGDSAAALEVLKRFAPAGEASAEYRGFTAVLLQRTGNHADAIDQFVAAVQLAPHHGPYWVGLAMAQQATGRKVEAADAFQRAKASGTLGPDLVALVDQRLRQLQ